MSRVNQQIPNLVQKLHAVIKNVHHLENMKPAEGKPEPCMISRMVDIIADMSKLASPTENTRHMIIGNAKNWGHNTYIILIKHYENRGMELLGDLSPLPTAGWREAFEVAVCWATRYLK